MTAYRWILAAAGAAAFLLAAASAEASPAGQLPVNPSAAAGNPLTSEVHWRRRCWWHRGHWHCRRTHWRHRGYAYYGGYPRYYYGRPAFRFYFGPRRHRHRW